MDITKVKHVHFTGIKGVGMASLALCFQEEICLLGFDKILSSPKKEKNYVSISR